VDQVTELEGSPMAEIQFENKDENHYQPHRERSLGTAASPEGTPVILIRLEDLLEVADVLTEVVKNLM
jgi:hypothetical protein